MKLEDIKLSEINQPQRDEFHLEEASEAVPLLEAQSGMVVARGWEEEEEEEMGSC